MNRCMPQNLDTESPVCHVVWGERGILPSSHIIPNSVLRGQGYDSNFHILQDMRPKKPNFAITRGYAGELWEMTACYWKEDPTGRPAIGYVLDMLGVVAEQWKPRRGEFSTLSPQDDWSPTLSAKERDSPTDSEPESESVIERLPMA